ncbi:MAG: hypothetical protein NTV05_08830 [Acidobacteria bacterium]|nr:hypothetical protein [Acidobacteriota bacterium]
MIIGVYWTARPESAEEVANRLSRFLGSLSTNGKELKLGQWFRKGSSRASARKRLATDASSIAKALRTNRRDVDGTVMLELGYRLSIWNGDDVSFDATIGSFNAHVTNAAVLSFADDALPLSADQGQTLLEAAVLAFEPEHGVVASHKQLLTSNETSPWAAGWFTYDRQGGVRRHVSG